MFCMCHGCQCPGHGFKSFHFVYIMYVYCIYSSYYNILLFHYVTHPTVLVYLRLKWIASEINVTCSSLYITLYVLFTKIYIYLSIYLSIAPLVWRSCWCDPLVGGAAGVWAPLLPLRGRWDTWQFRVLISVSPSGPIQGISPSSNSRGVAWREKQVLWCEWVGGSQTWTSPAVLSGSSQTWC